MATTEDRRPDLDYVAARERPRNVELTREEILILLAALHKELARIRSVRADDPEAVARANHKLGLLIGRLEDADAHPLTPEHSADAVQ